MKAWLTVFAALLALWGFGVVLPERLIGSGIDDFGNPGDPERRMAAKALFHGPGLFGSGFLEISDYNGPPLVLGWHVKSVKRCPPLPNGEKPEADSYRAYGGGNARIGAYGPFGVPRGEMEVTCGGGRVWEGYNWGGRDWEPYS